MLLFDSALVWPLAHNKVRLEEMTDTFLAAGEMGVLLFFTVKENSIICVYSSVCVFFQSVFKSVQLLEAVEGDFGVLLENLFPYLSYKKKDPCKHVL